MAKILIIEDDEDIAAIEKDYLELSGFQVSVCSDGVSGLTAALEQPFDLLLLDLMLPGMDGFTICRRVREVKDIPILMVTALGKDVDKIRGLGYGADDYIEKPFSPSVLVARVKAHLAQYRRLKPSPAESMVLTVGPLTTDTASRRVAKNGEEVPLKNKEYELLVFLMRHPGQVFSREDLYEMIWGLESLGDNITVAVHINRLREKMEDDPAHPQLLQTVWGVGYRLQKRKVTDHVDIVCLRFGAVRRSDGHFGQMRHPQDGFHRGHRHPHHCGAGVFVADGVHRWLAGYHRRHQRKNAAVSGAVRPCHRRELAVLFQGTAVGRCE